MKKKKLNNNLYQNGYFLSGLGLSALFFLLMGGVLHSSGFLQFGGPSLSTESIYADSTSPRKHGPNWYIAPTPDPNGWDQITPTISFVSPVDGSIVDPNSKVGSYYIIPVELSAYDNDKIAHVAVYVNNVIDGFSYFNATSYKVTARIPNQAGTYVIKAIAYDYNGNAGEATSSVIVTPRGK